jgi:hypothetical protein
MRRKKSNKGRIILIGLGAIGGLIVVGSVINVVEVVQETAEGQEVVDEIESTPDTPNRTATPDEARQEVELIDLVWTRLADDGTCQDARDMEQEGESSEEVIDFVVKAFEIGYEDRLTSSGEARLRHLIGTCMTG